MDLNRRKEEFSNAFVQAVVSAAGYTLAKPSVDDDSVDWMIAASKKTGEFRSPRLELQLKSTSNVEIRNAVLPFPLKLKNYDELRPTNFLVPRILVVVLLPDNVDQWLELSEERLVLRHCAYWTSLRGREEVDNDYQVTVHLPEEQKFDVQSLSSIMSAISRGDRP